MMDRDERLNLINRMFVEMHLERVALELPAMLITLLGGNAQRFTPDYILGLALTLFTLCAGIPAPLLLIGGAIKLADMLYQQSPEKFTLAEIAPKLREGFNGLSPSFAAALTDDVLKTAVSLLLIDWAEDSPTLEDVQNDPHLFIHMAMEYVGTMPDRDIFIQESRTTMEQMVHDDSVSKDTRNKIQQMLNQTPPDDLPPF